MILIVGSRTDPHVSAVAHALNHLGAQFRILDSFSYDSDGLDAEIAQSACLKIDGETLSVDDVSAVWWRHKPRSIVPSDKASELYDYYFEAREWNQIYEYLSSSLSSCYAINKKDNAAAANNKLIQLSAASDLGFSIPRTLITNSASAALDFIKSLRGSKAIFKTLTPYMNPIGKSTYTNLVDAALVAKHADALKFGPGIFQEFIPKAWELRVTVVESDIFVAKINSTAAADAAIDWREAIFDDIYEPYILPSSLSTQIIRLQKRLGIAYGAYDFVVGTDERPVFLEVNPMGQWMWLEERLGLPISARIAQALARFS